MPTNGLPYLVDTAGVDEPDRLVLLKDTIAATVLEVAAATRAADGAPFSGSLLKVGTVGRVAGGADGAELETFVEAAYFDVDSGYDGDVSGVLTRAGAFEVGASGGAGR